MSKKESSFYKIFEASIGEVVGEFANKHGEKFVVYTLHGIKDVAFVTGDEIDWEFGWQYAPEISSLSMHMVLSPEEKKKLDDVITSWITKPLRKVKN